MLLEDLEGDLHRSHKVTTPRAGSYDSWTNFLQTMPGQAAEGLEVFKTWLR